MTLQRRRYILEVGGIVLIGCHGGGRGSHAAELRAAVGHVVGMQIFRMARARRERLQVRNLLLAREVAVIDFLP